MREQPKYPYKELIVMTLVATVFGVCLYATLPEPDNAILPGVDYRSADIVGPDGQ